IAGLAVTYGLNLNMIQAWVIWNLCNLENKIISVERMLQYTTIPSEPPLVLEEEKRPDPSWPAYGEVDIRNLQNWFQGSICSTSSSGVAWPNMHVSWRVENRHCW
ncbi:ABC transporter C family member 3-like, partial [Trifolium medium]|nr:ABC transporter C family member 3-like [Trifolium medium]